MDTITGIRLYPSVVKKNYYQYQIVVEKLPETSVLCCTVLYRNFFVRLAVRGQVSMVVAMFDGCSQVEGRDGPVLSAVGHGRDVSSSSSSVTLAIDAAWECHAGWVVMVAVVAIVVVVMAMLVIVRVVVVALVLLGCPYPRWPWPTGRGYNTHCCWCSRRRRSFWPRSLWSWWSSSWMRGCGRGGHRWLV